MPVLKCEFCEQILKSKISMKKHKCEIKELTSEQKLEAVYQQIKLFDMELEMSIHLMRQDKDLFMERMCKLLEKPKFEKIIVNETVDIQEEIEDI